MNKRIIFTCCILALVIAATPVFARGGQDASASYTIKVGDNWGSTHPMGKAVANIFKTQVEEKTNKMISVEIYSDGTLGNEGDLWNGVRNGTIEMAIVGTPFNKEWPVSMISDWPFLYRDVEHAQKV